MNLNPAGLGVGRGLQFGVNIQQSDLLDINNSNLFIFALIFYE